MCSTIQDTTQLPGIEDFNTKFYRPYNALCDALWIFSTHLQNEATDVDGQGVYVQEFLEQSLGNVENTSKKVDEGLMKYRDCLMNISNLAIQAKGLDLGMTSAASKQSYIANMVLSRITSSIKLSCTLLKVILDRVLPKAIGTSHAEHMV